jgi:hypothetical protein
MRSPLAPALVLAAACSTTGGDPWKRSMEVLREGDVVACLDARRSSDGLELRWVGVRAEGESRLRSVRLIVFCDANGDLEPQPEEQLTRWEDLADEPRREFSVRASFRSTHMPPEVLERLRVATEIGVEGRPEPVRANCALQ